jgi:hypothetical protein
MSLALPVSIMIDDSAPCINILYWQTKKLQSSVPRQISGEPIVSHISNDFLHKFVEVVHRYGLRGKFTVLPYPAGLGSISQGLDGYQKRELDEWLEVVKHEVTPLFDITPEILTHTKALDLQNHQLLPEDEHEWAIHQTESTLTQYISHALRILRDVGLDATGVTSPWSFGSQAEKNYQLAILDAQKQVNNLRHTWYFLHFSKKLAFQSKIVYHNPTNDDWVVSIVAQCEDFMWQTMETQQMDNDYIYSIADLYLTKDGKQGRLSKLFSEQIPVVLATHWQSLFSNGRTTGLQVLKEVVERIEQLWGKNVKWTKCSELATKIVLGVDDGDWHKRYGILWTLRDHLRKDHF